MKQISFISILLLAALVAACGPDQRIIDSAKQKEAEREEHIANSNANAAVPGSFEADLNAMRTADFKFILVFRRKDDHPLDAADKSLISRNTGMQANRRTLSDEGKAVIIAGNFPFATKPMNELTAKFKMENYSKPDSGPFVSDQVETR